MAMPEFTAGASTYRSVRQYAVRTTGTASSRIVPAERLMSSCGLCTCDPGKCCEQTLFGCECYTCGSGGHVVRPRLTYRTA